jgi:hypothetical protein
MNDERIFERLAAHGGAVEVDPGFEDQLYTLLQRELRQPERSSPRMLLLVAAVLTILVIGAAVAVGSGLIEFPLFDQSPTPSPSSAASEPLASPSAPVPAEPGWTATGSMVEASRETLTLLLDGSVLATGGSGPIPDSPLRTAEVYDPVSETWIPTQDMVTPHGGHTATLLNDGRVLVAGGGSPVGPLAVAELYDPRGGGSWSATGDMIVGHGGHLAVLLADGRVLVAGGGSGASAPAELFDPSSGTWTATGDMVEVRSEATMTLLNDGRVLVAGGQFFGVGTAELYDPNSGTWSTTGSMTAGRIGHTATLLPDGTVLAVGGYTNDTSGNFATQLASAELYDPASGTWTPAGSMLEAHIDHTATLLLNGTVLVAGGTSELGPAGAELYDPAAATWVGAPSTIEARSGHLATILADGRVLVAGGSNSTGPLTSAELYDPGTGT